MFIALLFLVFTLYLLFLTSSYLLNECVPHIVRSLQAIEIKGVKTPPRVGMLMYLSDLVSIPHSTDLEARI